MAARFMYPLAVIMSLVGIANMYTLWLNAAFDSEYVTVLISNPLLTLSGFAILFYPHRGNTKATAS